MIALSVKTALLQLIVRSLALLPLPLLRGMGRAAGWLLYRLPNRERETARVNLRLCFPQLKEEERAALLRRSLRETATTLLEMPAIWHRRSDYWLARLDPGPVREEILALHRQGRGVIVAMPHMGNFELSAPFFGHLGLPATGLYRPPRQAGLEAVMVAGRCRSGAVRMVPTTRQGIRELHRALARGEMVGILPDQQPKKGRGGTGVFAPFMGVPAWTMTLLGRLARKSGAPVYFLAFLRRPGSSRYQVVGRRGDAAIGGEDLERSAAALNAGVEAMVRLAPEQYQWTYRRFEQQPDGSNPYRPTEGS